MPFQPTEAEVVVRVFKEGLLSPLVYDLKIRVKDAVVEVDLAAVAVRARFGAGSLSVECAVKDAREAPEALSQRDRDDIEAHIRGEVLHAARYPKIVFESTEVHGGTVRGRLMLHGVSREICFPWREEGAACVAEVRLDQREWGVVPYRGLMGTMRIRPEVLVQVRLRAGPRTEAAAA